MFELYKAMMVLEQVPSDMFLSPVIITTALVVPVITLVVPPSITQWSHPMQNCVLPEGLGLSEVCLTPHWKSIRQLFIDSV